jgi:SAM-dependent methyltransferase
MDYINTAFLNGKLYDRLRNNYNQDLEFWSATLQKLGPKVLELGCGTGRVAIYLSENGFDVSGIDNSRAMLREAKIKAKTKGLSAKFQFGDFTSFQINELFNAVITPDSSFSHLLTDDLVESCLQCIKQHLLKDGKLIFSVNLPEFDLESFNIEMDDGVILNIYPQKFKDDIYKKIYKVSNPSTGESLMSEIYIRLFKPDHLDKLLIKNGLKIENKFGDYQGNKFDKDSKTQLFVCSFV